MKNVILQNSWGRSYLFLFLCLFQLLSFKAKAEDSYFILHCPQNRYVSCTDEIWNLSIYGNATYSTPHGTFSAGTPEVRYFLNSCNTGYITRTWRVEDNYWNWHTCVQTIYVSSSGGYNQLNIVWPLDYEVDGCNPNVHPNHLPAPHNIPTWTSNECRWIGRSYKDQVFFVNSSCRKIMRTWKLIDWCNEHGSNNSGSWTHVQIIKVVNSERPQVNCVNEIHANAFNCKNVQVNAAPLEVDAASCGGVYSIINNSPFSTSKGADISGVYPIGTTKVTYTIQYGCGSRITCVVNVIVKNANKPTPYCYAQLTTALMPIDANNDGIPENGMVQIWAKDLNKASESLCGFKPLRFSFSKDPNDMVKTFTCDHVGKNQVEMWVTDSKGGQSYCIVEVHVQNNTANIPNCIRKVEPDTTQNGQFRKVKGQITNAHDVALVDADIFLNYIDPILTFTSRYDTTTVMVKDSFVNSSGYLLYFYKKQTVIKEIIDTTIQTISLETKSDENGLFLFNNLTVLDKAILISGWYADELRKGVNSKDVDALTKHLLGEKLFDKPYQYLAADVDGNGKIDLVDLNILIDFIANNIEELPTGPWIVLNGEQTFVKPEDILTDQLFNAKFIEKLSTYTGLIKLVGIKIGDIVPGDNITNENVLETRLNTSLAILPSIYPNPVMDQFVVSLNTVYKGDIVVSVFDLTGKEYVRTTRQSLGGKSDFTISVDHLPSGMFTYKLLIGEEVFSGKLIKI